MSVDQGQLLTELEFQTSRSSGSGGQNVNKVETRVEALWDVEASRAVSDQAKRLIQKKLANRINNEGILRVDSQEARTQGRNKELAIKKLQNMVEHALRKPKKRKRTKPSKASKEKRIQQKKQQGEKKEMRKKIQ